MERKGARENRGLGEKRGSGVKRRWMRRRRWREGRGRMGNVVWFFGFYLIDTGLVCGNVVDADVVAIFGEAEGDGFTADVVFVSVIVCLSIGRTGQWSYIPRAEPVTMTLFPMMAIYAGLWYGMLFLRRQILLIKTPQPQA